MTRLPGFILCMALLFTGISCSIGSNETGTGGIITASSGCKSQTQGKAGIGLQAASDTYQSNKTYVLYSDEGKTLSLKHINAAFNCCPESITASATIANGTILIEEKEDTSRRACNCLCLYDLDMKIENVEAGQYVMKFIEPYRYTGDPAIEFTIDLAQQTSGVFEAARTKYPWYMP